MWKRLCFGLTILASTTACAGSLDQMQSLTSGSIGCPPREIAIADVDGYSIGYWQSWQAKCRTRTFRCSVGGGNVSCAELLPVVIGADAEANGTGLSTLPPPAPAPPVAAPPVPAPVDRDAACRAALDYDKRAAAATEPAKTQLEKMAARKHKDCDTALSEPWSPTP